MKTFAVKLNEYECGALAEIIMHGADQSFDMHELAVQLDDIFRLGTCSGGILAHIYDEKYRYVQPPLVQGWMHMSTAPKDGTRFIAYDPRNGLLFTMHWNDEWLTDYESWSGTFTHWMPRPARP